MLATLVGSVGGVGATLIGALAALRARRPRKSRVELVDLSLPPPDPAKDVRDDLPVFDVKVRNTGGQPAVLKRVVVHTNRAVRLDSIWLTPYVHGFPRYIGARLDVSATYDVTLPVPEEATGARVTIDISQVVAPGEADRFLVRLGRSSINNTVAYLLHLEVVYDADDHKVISPPVAVAFPQRALIESVEQIRSDLHEFQEEVSEVRQAIGREMVARGRPTPDWITTPPRGRDELPGGLLSVDGNGNPLSSGTNCVYVVNENFWDPQRAIERHPHTIETRYRELVEAITSATVVHEVLRDALPRVHATLTQLPALQAEFCAPETAITGPPPTGDPEDTDQLARLLEKLRNLEELRARADGGDQKAAQVLHLATRLATLLEDEGPDDPETLETRYLLAAWQGAEGDAAGAVAAFAELLPERLRIQSPDHRETLLARHHLARLRGEMGDPADAAEAFAELLPDQLRVLGPDHPDTLASQRALAYWQDQTRPR